MKPSVLPNLTNSGNMLPSATTILPITNFKKLKIGFKILCCYSIKIILGYINTNTTERPTSSNANLQKQKQKSQTQSFIGCRRRSYRLQLVCLRHCSVAVSALFYYLTIREDRRINNHWHQQPKLLSFNFLFLMLHHYN